jgi:hypothetical protein
MQACWETYPIAAGLEPGGKPKLLLNRQKFERFFC